MTLDELEASVALIKSQGIVESGDALKQGIGTMNSARIRDFYDNMVRAGLYKADEVDLAKVVELRFVNKKAGLGPTR